MLADKKLLSAALLVTFASGTFVGHTAAGRPSAPASRPLTAEAAYAPQISDLRRRGYDETELADAKQAYADYFKGYESFWNVFCETYRGNLDKFEDTLERRLDGVEARFRARAGAK